MPVTLTFPNATNPGFELLSFELHDDMSKLFRLDLTVQSTNAGIEMAALVGQRVALVMEPESPLPRVTGIIREMKVISTETTGVTRYRLHVAPPLWLTTRRVNCRIFQNRTVVQIVGDILADYGGRIDAPVEHLGGSFHERAYTAQYGETDHDFIFRILSDEGIATFFEHANSSRWALVDQTDSLTPELTTPIPYIEPSRDQAAPMPSVQAVIATAKMKTSALAVRDYDHLNPSLIIQARATTEGAELFVEENDLESYSFDIGYVRSEEQAKARSERLLEASRVPGRRLEMTTNFAIGPGTRITLVGHPHGDVDGRLLVTRLVVVGQEHTSFQHLECIDAASPFRPRRIPPPRIIGTQTAFVVPTNAGDRIDADKLGQVKVEFRWDRRGLVANTSRFIRVSQAWAGQDYGLICLPRVGDEVIVDFLNGDPDQPIIIGRVHNAVNFRPFDSPADETISVWRSKSSPGGKGFNQILLDDKAGAERLEFHAQRDFKSETGRNAVTTVASNETKRVGGSSSTTISGAQTIGTGSTSISTGPYTLSAKKIDQKAKTDISITAADILTESSVNHFVNTGGFWVGASAVMQLVTPRFVVFSGDIMLNAGGSSIHVTSGGIKIVSGGTIEINGAVVDVKGAPIKLNC